MSPSRATRSHVLLFIATILAATPFSLDAKTQQVKTESTGVIQTIDGTFRLALDADQAPPVLGPYERYGLWDSRPLRLGTRFRTVQVSFRDVAPAGTESIVSIRASTDGQRWSEWEWDVTDGARIPFDRVQRWIQYRIVLLGSTGRTPLVSDLMIVPRATYRVLGRIEQAEPAVAPTYRLRVTRMGMVGGRTANGYRIKPRDFFASLPSWKSLSSLEGREYKVRLSANGESVVVPVMDVGPWNVHDNYWDAERQRFKDLPTGWPQDHAAYYENYNRRRAEKGWVRFPSAVDIGDGAYWALGLRGAQATVDVTFLWLGEDPGPNPAPLNARPSQRP
jgi:hypothetical protein